MWTSAWFRPLRSGTTNQVIPLYREELAYKLEHDADALIEQMAEVSFVVHPDRPNSVAE